MYTPAVLSHLISIGLIIYLNYDHNMHESAYNDKVSVFSSSIRRKLQMKPGNTKAIST